MKNLQKSSSVDMKVNIRYYIFLMLVVSLALGIWAYGYGKDAANREKRINNTHINIE